MDRRAVDGWYAASLRGLVQAREHLTGQQKHGDSLSAIVTAEIPSAIRSLRDVKRALYESLDEPPDRWYGLESELQRFGSSADDGEYNFPLTTAVRGRTVSTIWNANWGDTGRYETVVFAGRKRTKPVYERGYSAPQEAAQDHARVVLDVHHHPESYRWSISVHNPAVASRGRSR